MSLLYRLDASDTATLFADTGKTTAITDGTGVAAWTPKAGAVATDALQSVSANRPTYRANYASTGYAGVDFDGSNDFMTVAHSSGWDDTTAYEIVAVVYLASAVGTGFRMILQKTNTSSWANNGLHFAHQNSGISGGSPTYTQNGLPEFVGERILVYLRSSSTTGNQGNIGRTLWPFEWRRVASGNTTPSTNTEAVRIGSGYPSGFHFSGAIHEIRVYAGGETSGDLTTIWTDMAKRWGILSAGGMLVHPGMSGGMRG